MVNDEVERLRQAIAPLCEPLHSVFTWADKRRRTRLPELARGPEYRWHATHTTRALAHHRLRRAKRHNLNLGAWRLSGNHARNGELWLTDDNYRIRVLHALSEMDVPPPGTNATRRAYYRNAPLSEVRQLFGPDNDRLLALWRIDLDAAETLPVFRIVRPIGEWNWGGHAQADISFVLPGTAEQLAGLRFEPSDEGLELDIPNETEGGTEDAGGSTG